MAMHDVLVSPLEAPQTLAGIWVAVANIISVPFLPLRDYNALFPYPTISAQRARSQDVFPKDSA
jgi:hypothetical protein